MYTNKCKTGSKCLQNNSRQQERARALRRKLHWLLCCFDNESLKLAESVFTEKLVREREMICFCSPFVITYIHSMRLPVCVRCFMWKLLPYGWQTHGSQRLPRMCSHGKRCRNGKELLVQSTAWICSGTNQARVLTDRWGLKERRATKGPFPLSWVASANQTHAYHCVICFH